MHNLGVSKTDNVQQKTIFSCNAYRNKSVRANLRPNNFKSSSQTAPIGKDPQILYVNERIFKTKHKLKEGSTQTSKTILQLAQSEAQQDLENNQEEESQKLEQVEIVETQPKVLKPRFLNAPRLNSTVRVGDWRRFEQTQTEPEKATVSTCTSRIPRLFDESVQKTVETQSSLKPSRKSLRNAETQNSIKSKKSLAVGTSLEQNVNQKVSVGTAMDLQDVIGDQLRTLPQIFYVAPAQSAQPQNAIGVLNLQKHLSDFGVGEVQTEFVNQPGPMSPDSLGGSPRNYSLENCPYSVASKLSGFTLDGSCHEQNDCLFYGSNKSLTQTFLERSRSKISYQRSFKSKSFIDSYSHPNYIQEPVVHYRIPRPQSRARARRRSSKSLDLPDNSFAYSRLSKNSGFMCPTTASLIKSQMEEIQSTNYLIPAIRRGKSTSPKPSGDRRRFESSRKIPYIDQSKSDVSSSTTLINTCRKPELKAKLEEDVSRSECSLMFSDDALSLLTTLDLSNSSSADATILVALRKLQEQDWRIALRGLADLVEICRLSDVDIIYEYMGTIYKRLIELLKSPRSHVCKIACQAAGHLFEYVKDTRRPLFDEIIDLLLHKTADANKFIRQNANMALDCMVTHVPIFNAVRSLCNKGPYHKNQLVRCATARLLVCAVVIAGVEFVMNPNNNEYTRRLLVLTMAKFLEDKSLDTRKLAERLYKVLSKDNRFDVYMKKYLEKEQIVKIKTNLRLIYKK